MWRWAVAVALVLAALSHADALKRAEMSAAPFVLGSRYGRSEQRELSLRNDRFFMGSRYGKRAADAPWRAGCDCRPARAWPAAVLRTFYMRRPEVMKRAPEQD